MAITGAFGAGFVKGFADDFVGRVDARTEKQDKYMDLMIENARAKAPKYAAYKAQQTQLDSLGKQLQTDFNLTKAEVEFLKGKGALQDFHKTVYEQRNAAEAVNQTYNFDKNLFFAAMNLEDRTLPMNTADRLAVAGKAYNESVSGSKNPKSETTRVHSAKNALARLLAFNPRLGAEETVRAMEIAGYSADELMDWDPNAPRQDLYSDIALPTTAIPVVEFTAAENKTVVNESGTKLRRLIGIEDASGNPLDVLTGDALATNAPKNQKTLELAALTEEGANTFAQINKRLAYQGLGNPQQLNVLSNRYSALSYFRSKIDTEEELRLLIDKEKKGLVTEFLLNNPMPTDEQINDFFAQDAETNDVKPKDVKPKDVKPKDANSVSTAAETPVSTAANVVVDSSLSNAALVETVLNNSNNTKSDMAALGLTDDDLALQRREEALNDLDEGKFTTSSDAAVIEEALARSDAIDEKLALQRKNEDEEKKRIQDNDRQFLADEKNYPQPPKDLPPIDWLTVNTEADLKGAIAKRIGEMPPDYKVQVASALESLNEALKDLEVSTKDFETSVNVGIEKAIDAVSVDNLAEAISNMSKRMFDTVIGDETLEERIMKNEGQRNRAAALAKLQEQFAALTLFPERTPVDIKDIDPWPTMDQMGAERLHALDDKINTSIASTAKAFLAKLGIGKSNEESETKAEPLVARPKKTKKTQKPKEMTSSDKARLRRAQKANELSGDSALLEMLVEKYGIALVQKEMGL